MVAHLQFVPWMGYTVSVSEVITWIRSLWQFLLVDYSYFLMLYKIVCIWNLKMSHFNCIFSFDITLEKKKVHCYYILFVLRYICTFTFSGSLVHVKWRNISKSSWTAWCDRVGFSNNWCAIIIFCMSRLYVFVLFFKPLWIQYACLRGCSFPLQIDLVGCLEKELLPRQTESVQTPNTFGLMECVVMHFARSARALVFYNNTCRLACYCF